MSVFRILKDVAAVGREIVKEGVKFVVEQLSGTDAGGAQEVRPSDVAPAPGASTAPEESPAASGVAPEAPVDAVEAVEEDKVEAAPPKETEVKASEPSSPSKAKSSKKRKTKTTASKKTSRKTAENKKKTAADVIYEVIASSEGGIDTATLIEKTGFTPKKVHNNVYKLRKAGKIKTPKKGYYTLA